VRYRWRGQPSHGDSQTERDAVGGQRLAQIRSQREFRAFPRWWRVGLASTEVVLASRQIDKQFIRAIVSG
jgi:hypothetical protein